MTEIIFLLSYRKRKWKLDKNQPDFFITFHFLSDHVVVERRNQRGNCSRIVFHF